MRKKKRRGPPPICQNVNVIQTESFIALESLSGYGLVWPEDGSVPEFMAADSDARALGAALLAALARCRHIPLNDPDSYDMVNYIRNSRHSEKELLRRTGKRTKTEAYKNALWCCVRRAEGEIHIQPFRPATRGKWDMLPVEMCGVIPETVDSESLGGALILALERVAIFAASRDRGH